MSSSNTKTKSCVKEEYDNIPVYYCKSCLSLRVMSIRDSSDSSMNYCDECGNTEIGETSIQEWEEMYKRKYGFDYLNN